MRKRNVIAEKGDPGPKDRKPVSPKIQARPKNWLEPVLLASLRSRNSYGYEMMERTATLGFGIINPGTMYRTLRRMEDSGLCKSEWETSKGGPARRRYSITDAGEAYLGLWAEALDQYRRNMDAFFRLYAGHPPRGGEEKREDG